MNTHDEETKERAMNYAALSIDRYRAEIFGSPYDEVLFWNTAKKKFPELLDEIMHMKKALPTESDVQQYILKVKVFESKSKELIRRVAVEIKIS